MRQSQLRRLSLLLVVCFLTSSAFKAPVLARAEADADAADIEDADAEIDVGEEPAEEVDEKDVVVLTEKTFNDTVLKAPFALVRFTMCISPVTAVHLVRCIILCCEI